MKKRVRDEKNTVNETEPMVITRILLPHAIVWKAWTDPKYVMQCGDRRLYFARFVK